MCDRVLVANQEREAKLRVQQKREEEAAIARAAPAMRLGAALSTGTTRAT